MTTLYDRDAYAPNTSFPGDKAVVKMRDDWYLRDSYYNQTRWIEGDLDLRFLSGDQSLFTTTYGDSPSFGGRPWNFNLMQNTINSVAGIQANSRKLPKVLSRRPGMEETAEQYTKVLRHIHDEDDIDDTLGDAFYHACTVGMNLLMPFIDYNEDPISGRVRVKLLKHDRFIIDPYWEKQDLSDCNYVIIRSMLTKNALKALYARKSAEIDRLQPGTRDGKFMYMPESIEYATRKEPLIQYDELYYAARRPAVILADEQTGDSIEWRGNATRLKQFMRDFPHIKRATVMKPTVRLACIANEAVLYNGPLPTGIDTFPFVASICYHEKSTPYLPLRSRGMVRDMRSTQYLFTRRLLLELRSLESTVNSGFYHQEGALVDMRELFQTGEGKGIALKKGKVPREHVAKIESNEINPSQFEVRRDLQALLPMISGVNPFMTGTDHKGEAGGIANILQQEAGNTALSRVLDKFDLTQDLLWRRIAEMVRLNYAPAKVARITGGEVPREFFTKSLTHYDVRVTEELETFKQRDGQFRQLMMMKQLGIEIPDTEIVRSSNLAEKDRILAKMEEMAERKSAMEEQQMKVQLDAQQAEANELNAAAQAEYGLSLERASRTDSNRSAIAERLAKAEHERDLAILEKIKAIKELESIDISQIQELLSVLGALRQESNAQLKDMENKVRTPNVEEVATAKSGEINAAKEGATDEGMANEHPQ
ncbi:MAG: hypothetical protein OXF02_06350 [Simkaniaceae bacterium]|nr:hypothetical protein [Simkaniaceae bacterium]